MLEDKESSKKGPELGDDTIFLGPPLLLASSHMGTAAGCFPRTPPASVVPPPAAAQWGLAWGSSLQPSTSCTWRGVTPSASQASLLRTSSITIKGLGLGAAVTRRQHEEGLPAAHCLSRARTEAMDEGELHQAAPDG